MVNKLWCYSFNSYTTQVFQSHQQPHWFPWNPPIPSLLLGAATHCDKRCNGEHLCSTEPRKGERSDGKEVKPRGCAKICHFSLDVLEENTQKPCRAHLRVAGCEPLALVPLFVRINWKLSSQLSTSYSYNWVASREGGAATCSWGWSNALRAHKSLRGFVFFLNPFSSLLGIKCWLLQKGHCGKQKDFKNKAEKGFFNNPCWIS